MSNLLSFSLRVALKVSPLLALIPRAVRIRLYFFLLLTESRCGTPVESLKQLFLISDRLDWLINERALSYGGGQHPKIRLTAYHQFFQNAIDSNDTVLDIGCSHGYVAASIAKHYPAATVIGLDRDKVAISRARLLFELPNLRFIEADATDLISIPNVDVIILSNVLEHISERVAFLTQLVRETKPRKLLIRVPLYERSWTVPIRDEIGMSYFTDDDHYVEHTLSQFLNEMGSAKIAVNFYQTLWGEIWARCTPLD
jgi:2-polyprenyl-3-methyl-5-hydroxy-6-metoxy-1,4-benzoquinol methylase